MTTETHSLSDIMKRNVHSNQEGCRIATLAAMEALTAIKKLRSITEAQFIPDMPNSRLLDIATQLSVAEQTLFKTVTVYAGGYDRASEMLTSVDAEMSRVAEHEHLKQNG